MSAPVALTLVTRRDCALCDAMLDALEALAGSLRFSLECVDVDRSPELFVRYNRDVPVLLAGEREICRHRLDRERLLAALALGSA